jgi:hypothetical protein
MNSFNSIYFVNITERMKNKWPICLTRCIYMFIVEKLIIFMASIATVASLTIAVITFINNNGCNILKTG